VGEAEESGEEKGLTIALLATLPRGCSHPATYRSAISTDLSAHPRKNLGKIFTRLLNAKGLILKKKKPRDHESPQGIVVIRTEQV